MARWITTIALIVVVSGMLIPATQAQSDTDTARELIAALNAWRVDEALWPLQPNTTLTDMAQAQADYLATLPDLPDNLHAGPDGKLPQERAVVAPYNWPTYGRTDRAAIGEIAYVGATVNAAIRWWQNSAIHARTVQNAGYREIGVGLAPHPYGYIMIVVFGSRPSVLPAQGDPSAGLLYLSDEQYTWAGTDPDWMHAVTQVRLLDAAGEPVSEEWSDWSLTLPLPATVGAQVSVEYTDGTSTVVTGVNLAAQVVLLPSTLALAAEPPPSETAAPESETDTATTDAPESVADTAAEDVAEDTAGTDTTVAENTAAENTAQDVAATEPQPDMMPDEMETLDSPPDVELVFDDVSLTVLNVSGATLDLSGLVFRYPDGELTFTIWRTQWLTAPLEAFPAGDCMQAWGWDETVDPSSPATCAYVRSAVTVSPAQRFWPGGEFEVLWGDTVLARCASGAGTCSFALLSE